MSHGDLIDLERLSEICTCLFSLLKDA